MGTSEQPIAQKVLHRSLVQEPISISHAKGNYLYTANNDAILDACGGAAVVSIGHDDERVIQAAAEGMRKVSFIHSGTFTHQPAEELADKLTRSAGMSRALFFSGGSEAIESAIKLARQYHLENGEPQRMNFIARSQSYHGNTLGALALGGHVARRRPFLPQLSGAFHSVSPCYPYRYKYDGESDDQYVKRLAKELEIKILQLGSQTVAAFFAETVVGAATGCNIGIPGYFKAIKNVCDRHGVLFVLDEIMCGVGRTGKLHAWEWEDVRPDIQVLGKGLGGGYFPISSVLVGEKVVEGLKKGSGTFNNGFTYQSHANGCRVALKILEIMDEDKLIEKCRTQGELLEKLLHGKLDGKKFVGNIRGRGLFWGVEFVMDKKTKAPFPTTMQVSSSISEQCLKSGLSIYGCPKGTIDGINGDHIIIAPPYTITDSELQFIVSTLEKSINELLGEDS